MKVGTFQIDEVTSVDLATHCNRLLLDTGLKCRHLDFNEALWPVYDPDQKFLKVTQGRPTAQERRPNRDLYGDDELDVHGTDHLGREEGPDHGYHDFWFRHEPASNPTRRAGGPNDAFSAPAGSVLDRVKDSLGAYFNRGAGQAGQGDGERSVAGRTGMPKFRPLPGH